MLIALFFQYVYVYLYLYIYFRKLLMQWGDYMVASLPDPGDQLCTDDFEGPSPHNVNLAAKVCFMFSKTN